MAITANTVMPITPVTPTGDASVPTQVFLADVATIITGDIVVWDTTPDGRIDRSNAAPTGDLIIGVATAPGNVIGEDVIIALAYPGVHFEGHIVAGAATDTTPPSTRGATLGIRRGFALADTPAVAAIDLSASTAATAPAKIIKWAGRQKGQFGRIDPFQASITFVNPRVVFAFGNSFWHTIA